MHKCSTAAIDPRNKTELCPALFCFLHDFAACLLKWLTLNWLQQSWRCKRSLKNKNNNNNDSNNNTCFWPHMLRPSGVLYTKTQYKMEKQHTPYTVKGVLSSCTDSNIGINRPQFATKVQFRIKKLQLKTEIFYNLSYRLKMMISPSEFTCFYFFFLNLRHYLGSIVRTDAWRHRYALARPSSSSEWRTVLIKRAVWSLPLRNGMLFFLVQLEVESIQMAPGKWLVKLSKFGPGAVSARLRARRSGGGASEELLLDNTVRWKWSTAVRVSFARPQVGEVRTLSW